MKHNIYSIFDQASGLYARPFTTQSDGEAIRSFTDVGCDAEHPIGKHPADYTLFRLGIFDDNTGKLTDEANTHLGNALERVASTQNVNKDNLDLLEKNIPATNAGTDPRDTAMDSPK